MKKIIIPNIEPNTINVADVDLTKVLVKMADKQTGAIVGVILPDSIDGICVAWFLNTKEITEEGSLEWLMDYYSNYDFVLESGEKIRDDHTSSDQISVKDAQEKVLSKKGFIIVLYSDPLQHTHVTVTDERLWRLSGNTSDYPSLKVMMEFQCKYDNAVFYYEDFPKG